MISRSRKSTPSSTTYESNKLRLEEQEVPTKTKISIALLGTKRLRYHQRLDERTRERVARKVHRRLRRPCENDIFRLPNLKTFSRSNRYQMVLREFAQNLAREFKMRKAGTVTRGNVTPRFQAWVILDGCEDASQSVIQVGREKVPLVCTYSVLFLSSV